MWFLNHVLRYNNASIYVSFFPKWKVKTTCERIKETLQKGDFYLKLKEKSATWYWLLSTLKTCSNNYGAITQLLLS